jgi:hypothetical protein
VRGHLTHLHCQPLSRAALVIVLSVIFDGFARHTAQLTQPEEAVPLRCRNIGLHRQWTPAGRIEPLGEAVAAHSEPLASVRLGHAS